MTKKFTVTIGIPALNEAANIGYLLKDLLDQKVNPEYKLDNIVVYSDASTDNTEAIVKELSAKNPIVKLISGQSRVGKSEGMNEIFSRTNSDAVIILDGDILVQDKQFINRIVSQVVTGKADLVSVLQRELPPQTFLEKIILAGMQIKNDIYWTYNHGQNLYTCHGHARAFSRRLYKSLRFPQVPGEDAYSYLYCVYNGYQYTFNSPPETWYKLPGSYSDHDKQSLRFLNSRKRLEKFFPPQFVRRQYRLPVSISLPIVLKHLLYNPLYSTLYLFVLTVSQFKSLFLQRHDFAKWDLSQTSKSLRS